LVCTIFKTQFNFSPISIFPHKAFRTFVFMLVSISTTISLYFHSIIHILIFTCDLRLHIPGITPLLFSSESSVFRTGISFLNRPFQTYISSIGRRSHKEFLNYNFRSFNSLLWQSCHSILWLISSGYRVPSFAVDFKL
jgi:hypothetical protein